MATWKRTTIDCYNCGCDHQAWQGAVQDYYKRVFCCLECAWSATLRTPARVARPAPLEVPIPAHPPAMPASHPPVNIPASSIESAAAAAAVAATASGLLNMDEVAAAVAAATAGLPLHHDEDSGLDGGPSSEADNEIEHVGVITTVIPRAAVSTSSMRPPKPPGAGSGNDNGLESSTLGPVPCVSSPRRRRKSTGRSRSAPYRRERNAMADLILEFGDPI